MGGVNYNPFGDGKSRDAPRDYSGLLTPPKISADDFLFSQPTEEGDLEYLTDIDPSYLPEEIKYGEEAPSHTFMGNVAQAHQDVRGGKAWLAGKLQWLNNPVPRSFLNLLDLPRAVVSNLLAGDFRDALSVMQVWKPRTEEEEERFNLMLKHIGENVGQDWDIEQYAKHGKMDWTDWVNFFGEVFTDPLTYATMGFAGGLRAAAKQTTRTGKLFITGMKGIGLEDVAKRMTSGAVTRKLEAGLGKLGFKDIAVGERYLAGLHIPQTGLYMRLPGSQGRSLRMLDSVTRRAFQGQGAPLKGVHDLFNSVNRGVFGAPVVDGLEMNQLRKTGQVSEFVAQNAQLQARRAQLARRYGQDQAYIDHLLGYELDIPFTAKEARNLHIDDALRNEPEWFQKMYRAGLKAAGPDPFGDIQDAYDTLRVMDPEDLLTTFHGAYLSEALADQVRGVSRHLPSTQELDNAIPKLESLLVRAKNRYLLGEHYQRRIVRQYGSPVAKKIIADEEFINLANELQQTLEASGQSLRELGIMDTISQQAPDLKQVIEGPLKPELIAKGTQAGYWDPATGDMLDTIVKKLPNVDQHVVIRAFNDVVMATDDAARSNGVVLEAGEHAYLLGTSKLGQAKDLGKSIMELHAGASADTVMHEWYHGWWAYMPENSRRTYMDFYNALGDDAKLMPGGDQPLDVVEHFAHKATDWFFGPNRGAIAPSQRNMFRKAKDNFVHMLRKTGDTSDFPPEVRAILQNGVEADYDRLWQSAAGTLGQGPVAQIKKFIWGADIETIGEKAKAAFVFETPDILKRRKAYNTVAQSAIDTKQHGPQYEGIPELGRPTNGQAIAEKMGVRGLHNTFVDSGGHRWTVGVVPFEEVYADFSQSIETALRGRTWYPDYGRGFMDEYGDGFGAPLITSLVANQNVSPERAYIHALRSIEADLGLGGRKVTSAPPSYGAGKARYVSKSDAMKARISATKTKRAVTFTLDPGEDQLALISGVGDSRGASMLRGVGATDDEISELYALAKKSVGEPLIDSPIVELKSGNFVEVRRYRDNKTMFAMYEIDQKKAKAYKDAETFGRGTKTLGLAADNLQDLVMGRFTGEGIGMKLADFADAGLGRRTRAWMGNHPAFGHPFPTDVWIARAAGYVDDAYLSFLKSRFADQPEVLRRLDAVVPDLRRIFKDGNAAQHYSHLYYQRLADKMNAEKFLGRTWTGTEAQAAHWTLFREKWGIVGGDVDSIVKAGRAEISFSAMPGKGTPLDRLHGEPFHALSRDLQERVMREVADEVVPIIERAVGVPHLSMEYVDGEFLYGIEPSMRGLCNSTPETSFDLEDALQLAFQQEECWGVFEIVPGAHKAHSNPNAVAMDFLWPAGKMAREERLAVLEAIRTKLDSFSLMNGSQQITPEIVSGRDGFRIIANAFYHEGSEELEGAWRFLKETQPGREAFAMQGAGGGLRGPIEPQASRSVDQRVFQNIKNAVNAVAENLDETVHPALAGVRNPEVVIHDVFVHRAKNDWSVLNEGQGPLTRLRDRGRADLAEFLRGNTRKVPGLSEDVNLPELASESLGAAIARATGDAGARPKRSPWNFVDDQHYAVAQTRVAGTEVVDTNGAPALLDLSKSFSDQQVIPRRMDGRYGKAYYAVTNEARPPALHRGFVYADSLLSMDEAARATQVSAVARVLADAGEGAQEALARVADLGAGALGSDLYNALAEGLGDGVKIKKTLRAAGIDGVMDPIKGGGYQLAFWEKGQWSPVVGHQVVREADVPLRLRKRFDLEKAGYYPRRLTKESKRLLEQKGGELAPPAPAGRAVADTATWRNHRVWRGLSHDQLNAITQDLDIGGAAMNDVADHLRKSGYVGDPIADLTAAFGVKEGELTKYWTETTKLHKRLLSAAADRYPGWKSLQKLKSAFVQAPGFFDDRTVFVTMSTASSQWHLVDDTRGFWRAMESLSVDRSDGTKAIFDGDNAIANSKQFMDARKEPLARVVIGNRLDDVNPRQVFSARDLDAMPVDEADDLVQKFGMGKVVVVSPEVKDELRRYVDNLNNLTDSNKIIRAGQAFTRAWKPLALLSSAFHFRNRISDFANAFMSGMPDGYWLRARRTLRAGGNYSRRDWIRKSARVLYNEPLPAPITLSGTHGIVREGTVIKTRGELFDLAQRVGMKQGLTAAELGNDLDNITDVRGMRAIANMSPNKLNRAIGDVNESWTRLALFEYGLDASKGNLADAMLRYVDRYAFGFHRMTKFEKSLSKFWMPFIRWSRYNVPMQIAEFFYQPSRQMTFLRFTDQIVSPEEDYRIPQYGIPEWMQGRMPVELGYRDEESGSHTMVPMEFWWPGADVAKLAKPGKTVMEMSNPLLQFFAEQVTGVDAFFKQKLESYPGETVKLGPLDLPKSVDYYARKLRPYGDLRVLTDPRRGPGGKAARILGLKSYAVDPASTLWRKVGGLRDDLSKLEEDFRQERRYNPGSTRMMDLQRKVRLYRSLISRYNREAQRLRSERAMRRSQ